MKNSLQNISNKIPLLIFSLFLFPIQSFAAGLVPCGGEGEPVCDFPQLMELVKKGMDFLMIDLALPVFIVGMFYVGWMYLNSGGKADTHTKARKIFWNLVIGFIIMLAAWLIVKTFIIIFTGDDPSFSTFFN